VTDRVDGDSRFIVVYETEPEHASRTANPFADEAREILEKALRDIMEIVLVKHELWSEVEARIKREVEASTKDDPAADATKIRAKILADLEKDGVDLTAPHNAVRITTGTGKSELGRQAIARFVIEARSRGLPHRVLHPVPTHRLADEARSKMPRGVTAAVWQGREGTKIGTDEPMCRNIEAVKAALKIGAEVESTICKHKEARCPFYETCHYQAQKAPAKTADVMFAAHEILFQRVAALGKNFGLVVVDEGFWQDGITGTRLATDRLDHELPGSRSLWQQTRQRNHASA
jgi:hypothetical protein